MDGRTPDGSIREGYQTSRSYTISSEVQDHFMRGFGDSNPLHVDDEAARARGFEQRVMHGMILGGFISHFIGVHFPGASSVIQAISLQFKSPCYPGDEILIEATVTQVVESVNVLAMDLVLRNVRRGRVAAKAKVQVGV